MARGLSFRERAGRPIGWLGPRGRVEVEKSKFGLERDFVGRRAGRGMRSSFVFFHGSVVVVGGGLACATKCRRKVLSGFDFSKHSYEFFNFSYLEGAEGLLQTPR